MVEVPWDQVIFQQRILKTAEEELSRPFAKDHSFVNIEHDEVLINEIDP